MAERRPDFMRRQRRTLIGQDLGRLSQTILGVWKDRDTIYCSGRIVLLSGKKVTDSSPSLRLT
jgi:hypothetical protein